jgi:hypothetical protein
VAALVVILGLMAVGWLFKGETVIVEPPPQTDVESPGTHVGESPRFPRLSVLWMFVPFTGQPGGGKHRPVIVLQEHEDSLVVLPLSSKPGPTTDRATFAPISAESSATFDRKAAPSWARVGEPLRLPRTAISYPTRFPGTLTIEDARRLYAVMSEYGLNGYIRWTMK